jgi:hypothetical protein
MGFTANRDMHDHAADARNAMTPMKQHVNGDDGISTPAGPMGTSNGPPSLGLGALFPAAAEKTPSVMTQSVAKGMQDARLNGGARNQNHTNGDLHTPAHAATNGGNGADGNSVDSSFAADTSSVAKVLDVGKTPLRSQAHLQPFQPVDSPIIEEEEPTIVPVVPPRPAQHKPPVVPPLPVGIIGLQQLDSDKGSEEPAQPPPKPEENKASTDRYVDKTVKQVDDGVVQWRDATVIDDTPLQQQFEEFMKQLKSPGAGHCQVIMHLFQNRMMMMHAHEQQGRYHVTFVT